MDLRAEVQRLVQEYLATREEDAAWMRGGWCTEKCDVYARLRDYVCRKLCRRFEWREWLDVRLSVIEHVRAIVNYQGDYHAEGKAAEAGEVSRRDAGF